LALLALSCDDDDKGTGDSFAADSDTRAPGDRRPPTTDAYQVTDCHFMAPDGITVECGVLTVPERHAVPDGPAIEIRVARFFSPMLEPAADPVVYLEGGPGASGIATVSGYFDAFSHLVLNRDLIVLDQRGTGLSMPQLQCTQLDYGELDLENTEEEDAYRLALASCRERFVGRGIAIDAYTSAENAADVEALRRALGYDAWNIYGISYGTRLALTVMRDHPAGIRSVVIDGVLPIELDAFSAIVPNAERAFERTFDYCARDPSCNAAYPNPMQSLVEVVTDLNAAPANVATTSGPIELSGDMVINILFLLMYDAESIAYVPAMIEMTAHGDYSLYEEIFSGQLVESYPIALGMYLSVNCAEEIPFTSLESVLAASDASEAVFLGVADLGIFEDCTVWDVPPAPDLENAPVRSDIPALVLSGELDPVTPPSNGDAVEQNLPRGTHYILPGQSHGASLSGCGVQLVRGFLRDPGAGLDASCVGALPPPDFLATTPPPRATRPIRFVMTPPSKEEMETLVERALRHARRQFIP
jgi:pimeloyl-ACP methyl ester carboxylesterase